jgi:hypothetical protein
MLQSIDMYISISFQRTSFLHSQFRFKTLFNLKTLTIVKGAGTPEREKYIYDLILNNFGSVFLTNIVLGMFFTWIFINRK